MVRGVGEEREDSNPLFCSLPSIWWKDSLCIEVLVRRGRIAILCFALYLPFGKGFSLLRGVGEEREAAISLPSYAPHTCIHATRLLTRFHFENHLEVYEQQRMPQS